MVVPLVVEFVSGEGMPAKDTSVAVDGGLGLRYLSDPYVRCRLMGADGQPKGPVRVSERKMRTLDPVWRFVTDFDLAQGEVLYSDELHITIYDEDQVGSDDRMGCARITVGTLIPEGRRYVLDEAAATPAAVEADRTVSGLPPSGGPVCALTVRRVPFQFLPSQMTLFFVRHGESLWNEAQEGMDVYGMLSQVDHPLNLTGIKQCAELQGRIAMEVSNASETSGAPSAVPAIGVKNWLAAQAIYASPLRRAAQTCLIALKGHPALRRQAVAEEGSAQGVPLTLISSAREIKKLGKPNV